MVRLYIAAAVALVAIGASTYLEARNSDRWTSSSVTAEEFGKRFEKVPKEVGKWVGTDTPVDKATLEMAGAVNHVSRQYVNTETNQTVEMWLIVGHAREICRHTPDICRPSQGFSQIGTKVKQRIEPKGDPEHPATFFTAKFRDESPAGGFTDRVFWAWNGNKEGKDQWEAPEYQKQYYGNNTALYKMYFTARMADTEEDIPQNVAVDFAKLMIPEVNKALFPERYQGMAPAADAAMTEGLPAATSDSAPVEPAIGGAADASAAPARAEPATEPAAAK